MWGSSFPLGLLATESRGEIGRMDDKKLSIWSLSTDGDSLPENRLW